MHSILLPPLFLLKCNDFHLVIVKMFMQKRIMTLQYVIFCACISHADGL
uniref:Uncharacterized protein n=1 Tax=Anguilla anguilla TaxID=7936 RepID=A0A0E9PSG0_ANGAN